MEFKHEDATINCLSCEGQPNTVSILVMSTKTEGARFNTEMAGRIKFSAYVCA